MGASPGDEFYRMIGDAAAAQSEPAADVRGPVDYKRAMVAEMIRAVVPQGRRARPVLGLMASRPPRASDSDHQAT